MTTSIILHNQALRTTPYNIFHLPPLVPGTNGVATPKPGADAVLCIAPGAATTYNEAWGQDLTLNPGDPHLAIASDDTYPNQVFHRDYVIKHGVTMSDPLARVLVQFWKERGFTLEHLTTAWPTYLGRLKKLKKPPSWMRIVEKELAKGSVFFFVKKEQPVIVRGVVDLRFTTSEGPTQLEHGAVLVQHPEDETNQWLIRAKKFAARYDWVKQPKSGLLIPTVVESGQ